MPVQKSFPFSLMFHPGQWEGNYPAGVFHLVKRFGTAGRLLPLTGGGKGSNVQTTHRVRPTAILDVHSQKVGSNN